MTTRNVAASVRARLLNHAREAKQDFNLVLTRFCLERLLYRISISDHANHFYLKGVLLFDLWFDVPHRPTRNGFSCGATLRPDHGLCVRPPKADSVAGLSAQECA
jgi:hypothetical protein